MEFLVHIRICIIKFYFLITLNCYKNIFQYRVTCKETACDIVQKFVFFDIYTFDYDLLTEGYTGNFSEETVKLCQKRMLCAQNEVFSTF